MYSPEHDRECEAVKVTHDFCSNEAVSTLRWENVILQLGQPSTLICHENGPFQKLSLNWSFISASGVRGGLMVSALVPGLSGPRLNPGWGQCVAFLGKTLYSHSASLHPGV